ncbi:MAG: SGNH/GDSL hydrolase family protein [Ferruginibacter sp.]
MNYTYLALGDSYTIGEQVLLSQSFPYQTIQMLRLKAPENKSYAAPEIIAKTGWTTDELLTAVEQTLFLKKYDKVSLLIGVNNQYRGRTIEEFKLEFTKLLQKAIVFAGNISKNVFVLSIPDWGATVFAEGRDRKKIGAEIDQFNEACRVIAEQFLCNFIDITYDQRQDSNKVDFLAPDGLHPSGNEYAKWAKKLSNAFLNTIE